MSSKEIKEIASKIQGMLREEEGEFLYNLAKNCKGKGVIVEIGSWKGKSTVFLARGSKAGNKVKVYAIDPHQGSQDHQDQKVANTFGEFKKNIEKAGVADLVEFLKTTSQKASKNWKRPIELLWIDGDHSFPMVKLDFELWSPHLIKGGIIAFHDAVSGGPKKVICDFVLKSNKFGNVGVVETIFYAQKINNLSLKDKIKNRTMITFLNIYEKVRKIPLPKFLRKIIKKIINKINKII